MDENSEQALEQDFNHKKLIPLLFIGLLLLVFGLAGFYLGRQSVSKVQVQPESGIICGDGTCDASEKCTPSSPDTMDCGSSYCQQDCN